MPDAEFHMPRAIRSIAALATLIMAISIFRAPAEVRLRPNIIMISVDTLRADRLSGYGYDRRTSPAIDALMSEGLRFDDALTTIPLTGPAFSSIMTSHYPRETGATRNGLPMGSEFPALAEILKRHGYQTGAIVGNWTLKHEISGMNRGFDQYNDNLKSKRTVVAGEQDARDVTDLALEWIDKLGDKRPFFEWAHYSDPHAPYEMREQFKFIPRRGEKVDSPSYRYDTEVAYTDFHIGRLLRGLEARGLKNDALIVFLADHGESLGEHGYFGHGRQLYQQMLRVPLAIIGPGIGRGITCKEGASLLDVMPTILSYLGTPQGGLRGVNLIAPGGWPAHLSSSAQFFETYRGAVPDVAGARKVMTGAKPLKIGIRDGKWKLIHTPENHRRELYDLSVDPLELKDISSSNGKITTVMTGKAWSLFCETRSENSAKLMVIPADVRRNLRSLGYLQ